MSRILYPSDERAALAADLLARESVYRYHAYYASLEARRVLRERMQMIITIDRAGTERCIAHDCMAAAGRPAAARTGQGAA